MDNTVNERLRVSKSRLRKQAVKTIKDPVDADEKVTAQSGFGLPSHDKMVKKLEDFLAYLYTKYRDAEITEHYKSQISKIIKEEIHLVSKLLQKKIK